MIPTARKARIREGFVQNSVRFELAWGQAATCAGTSGGCTLTSPANTIWGAPCGRRSASDESREAVLGRYRESAAESRELPRTSDVRTLSRSFLTSETRGKRDLGYIYTRVRNDPAYNERFPVAGDDPCVLRDGLRRALAALGPRDRQSLALAPAQDLQHHRTLRALARRARSTPILSLALSSRDGSTRARRVGLPFREKKNRETGSWGCLRS